MFTTIVGWYALAWVITAAGTLIASRYFAEDPAYTSQPADAVVVSLLAGAVWPILVIGAAEFVWMAARSAARQRRHPVPVELAAVIPLRASVLS